MNIWVAYWKVGLWNAFCMRVAWCLPRNVVYWCAVRVGCHATQGVHSYQIVPELTFMDALKRWDKPEPLDTLNLQR